jgi:hypothetical protein
MRENKKYFEMNLELFLDFFGFFNIYIYRYIIIKFIGLDPA